MSTDCDFSDFGQYLFDAFLKPSKTIICTQKYCKNPARFGFDDILTKCEEHCDDEMEESESSCLSDEERFLLSRLQVKCVTMSPQNPQDLQDIKDIISELKLQTGELCQSIYEAHLESLLIDVKVSESFLMDTQKKNIFQHL